jgi:hypothetical protein
MLIVVYKPRAREPGYEPSDYDLRASGGLCPYNEWWYGLITIQGSKLGSRWKEWNAQIMFAFHRSLIEC